MTTPVTSFNALAIRRVLGREDWAAPVAFGEDGWLFRNLSGKGSIVVSCADLGDVAWVHASISWPDHTPEYHDLTLLHRAAFGDGWAYQCFAPPAAHINHHEHALHLWGRLDGKPALPNFGQWGTI